MSCLARSVRLALGAFLPLLAAAPLAMAQGAPPGFVKTPVGPGITINPMNNQITAQVGEVIEWHIDLSNSYSTSPLYADFWDTPQDDECQAGGQSRAFESGTLNGSSQESAPQTAISFLDLDGDGSCAETVLDAAGGLVECDAATQTLVIYNAFVPGMEPGFPPRPGTARLRFLTYLDAATPPNEIMCNWGFVYDDKETPQFSDDQLFQPTSAPGGRTPGCTCMFAAPANSFDMDLHKTVQPDRLPLIPNDPASTVVYTITARNTGGADITSASLADQLPAGQQWVGIVSCPPPLSCNIAGDTLNVSGYNIPAADPDIEQVVQARARITCGLATDDDTGVACNQAEFSVMGRSILTDDPALPGIQDPTCINVVFSRLIDSEKQVMGYDDVDGDGLLSPGDVVHFRIRARNTGRLLAREVVIVDSGLDTACFDTSSIVAFDGGTVAGSVITWNVGDISGPLGFRDVRFDVTLTGAQVCCNQATVNSRERLDCGMAPVLTNDPTTAGVNDDPACALPGPRPDLRQEKTFALEVDRDASGGISNDDIVSHTVTITNVGAGTATGAQFRDDLLACHFRYLAQLPDNLPGGRIWPNEISTTDGTDWGVDNSVPYGGGLAPGNVIINNLGGANGIRPGEVITIKFYFRLQAMDRCCNQSRVTYTELPVPDLSDDPRTPGLVDDQTCFREPVSGPAAIFDKTVDVFDMDGDGYLGVGDRGTFHLSLTSSGTVPLTSLVITDAGDACYRVLPGTVVITPAAGGTDSSAGETITVSATGPLAPGDRLGVDFDVEWLGAGTCCNQATASSAELPALVSNDPRNFIANDATCTLVEVAPRPNIALKLDKLVAETGCQDRGAVLHYTLRVTNTGDTTVALWSLQDTLPAGMTGIVAVPPLAVAGSTVSVADISLAPAEVMDFTYEAMVPCAGSGNLVNDAVLSYDAAGLPQRKLASTTTAYGGPDLSLSDKLVVENDLNANGWLDAGETVDYTITVTNSGTCDARQVVVTDVLPAAFDAATAVVGQGGTLAGSTVTWDAASTPALATMAPATSVILTVSVAVSGGLPAFTRVSNAVDIVSSGNATAACGAPRERVTSPESCINCDGVPPVTQDLLVNGQVTSRAAALAGGELAALVVDSPSANTTTCGETALDILTDVLQADVGASLATGVTVPVASAAGPVVYLEVSERCQSPDGGSDTPICVFKDRATGDLIVRLCP